eukprot:CAMPEP_0197591204 /NCGR_PEP_ID=MMETSP1326-20131121/12940_1 /TAXON_ID=1155430 /ORGANISM="Genus nov. species nov., Strain RCC2288" /LENGTH=360 /DNA_ID=CAMNT_0043156589 /DNA_START=176 /DNA_END=1258 /DNA_ORIENTATION=-
MAAAATLTTTTSLRLHAPRGATSRAAPVSSRAASSCSSSSSSSSLAPRRLSRRAALQPPRAGDFIVEDDGYDGDEPSYSGNLCLFLDSASEEEWTKWLPTGIFSGVTTNPIILERDGRECTVAALTELAKQALEYDAVQEFQIQTWGASSEEMWKNGIALAKYDPDVIVVKVPATFDGIKAANALVADGIRVTLTAAYAPHQAVLAAAVGANYVAPYLGRMNDAGRDGMAIIVEMQQTVDALDSDMRILVASVRTAGDVAKLAAQGCDTFTISAKVAEDMFADPLTTQAALDFEAAAGRIGAYKAEGEAAAKKKAASEKEKDKSSAEKDKSSAEKTAEKPKEPPGYLDSGDEKDTTTTVV